MIHRATTLNLFWEDEESIGHVCQNKYHGNLTYKLPQFTLSVRWEDCVNMPF